MFHAESTMEIESVFIFLAEIYRAVKWYKLGKILRIIFLHRKCHDRFQSVGGHFINFVLRSLLLGSKLQIYFWPLSNAQKSNSGYRWK